MRAVWHRDLLIRWVRENPPETGTGWQPYPTSLRIVNWVKWAVAGNLLPDACVHSLVVQARTLFSRQEWHLLGNHLLANAKALAAQQRTSLTRLIEEGLQLRLRAQAAPPPRGKLRLPVFKGRGGLMAGVDPLSNKALLEALGDDT